MKKIGFIGYGSMGSMLVRGLIESGVNQDQIIVTRNNKERLHEIKEAWPDINTAEDAVEVTKKADMIFLCVKPMEFKDILLKIKSVITSEKHVISISAAINIEDIEKFLRCKITKILPTVTSEVKEGITLICHNFFVTDSDKAEIEALLQSFTHLSRIKEENFGLASEFTSCGPGLYAAILQEFVQAGLRYSGSLPKKEAARLILQTMYGTAKLMIEKDMDFSDVITRVATKGGITEEGVKVIQAGLPEVFDEIFIKSMEKRRLVDEKIANQFKDII